MPELPRFSLGTVQPEAELNPVLWALLDNLDRAGWRAQSYQSVANHHPVCGIRSITGQSQRHLDSWVMSRAACRELFERGSQASEVSIVSGRFDVARPVSQKSSLDQLSDWLMLPKIAVIDVQQLGDCRLPVIPEGTAALLLDKVRDGADGLRWRTNLEALYGVPVLGYLNRASKLRSLIAVREEGSPCREFYRALGERLEPTLQLDCLLHLASRAAWNPSQTRIFAMQPRDNRIRVAVAFDEAFQSYFPDTLDALEARGATICDFSPLHSESLPTDVDVVYIAGTRIEPWLRPLSSNICMKEALRSFVNRGGRIYAEGAGLAYLCERLVGADDYQYPMTGVIPAIGMLKSPAPVARPVEIEFAASTWLGGRGTRIRGYADDSLDLLGETKLTHFALAEEHRYDLVGDASVIGSRLQVDFAGQPHLLASFFRPRRGALVEV